MVDSASQDNLHLEIGDLIFILSDEKQTVVPAIVTDELVHKRLGGSVTSWKVQIGPPNSRRVVDTRQIKGTIYNDLQKVRDALLQRVTLFMDHLFGEVVRDSQEWYGLKVFPPTTSGGAELDGLDMSSEKTLDPDALLAGISRTPPPAPTQPAPQQGPTPVVLAERGSYSKQEVRAAMLAQINPDLVPQNGENGQGS